ncbi:phage scaffolding protein [Streptomyces rubiginosohelvolus]|uniref:phage scaffolding protein n=1 Tax=Streptomyces rubiginosohelvolus TaxID=67362 RepID=UPI0036EC2F7A
MTEENTETQVSDNDIKAMQAQLKKANSEAAHYRNERNTFKDRYVTLAAERTLSNAGITNPKVTKFLNLSEVTVTESGELEGLTEQLEALKEDLPELFGPVEKKVSGGADAADKKEARPQKSTATMLTKNFRNG